MTILSDPDRNCWRHHPEHNMLTYTPPGGSAYELDLDPLDRDGWDPREQLRRVKHIATKAFATVEVIYDLALALPEMEEAWCHRAAMAAVSGPTSPFARARGKLLEAQRETVGVLEARRNRMPPGEAKDRLCRALDSLARGVADADDELDTAIMDALRTEEASPATAGV